MSDIQVEKKKCKKCKKKKSTDQFLNNYGKPTTRCQACRDQAKLHDAKKRQKNKEKKESYTGVLGKNTL